MTPLLEHERQQLHLQVHTYIYIHAAVNEIVYCAALPPRASEAGVCRGSDTPTIYVGNIDMYIP